MRNFPVPFLNTLCPTPKTTLPHGGRLARPKILVQIEAVATDSFDHKSHFVFVTCRTFTSLDLGNKVCCCNFGLTHRHVAHLWPVIVHAVADRVSSFKTDDTHRPIDVDVAFVVCNPHVRGGGRTSKWRH